MYEQCQNYLFFPFLYTHPHEKIFSQFPYGPHPFYTQPWHIFKHSKHTNIPISIKNLNVCELDDYSSIPWTQISLPSLLCWDHARGSSGFISSRYCKFEGESGWVRSFNYMPTCATAKHDVRLCTTMLLNKHHVPIHQLLVNLWFKNESISHEQQPYICSSFSIHDACS